MHGGSKPAMPAPERCRSLPISARGESWRSERTLRPRQASTRRNFAAAPRIADDSEVTLEYGSSNGTAVRQELSTSSEADAVQRTPVGAPPARSATMAEARDPQPRRASLLALSTGRRISVTQSDKLPGEPKMTREECLRRIAELVGGGVGEDGGGQADAWTPLMPQYATPVDDEPRAAARSRTSQCDGASGSGSSSTSTLLIPLSTAHISDRQLQRLTLVMRYASRERQANAGAEIPSLGKSLEARESTPTWAKRISVPETRTVPAPAKHKAGIAARGKQH